MSNSPNSHHNAQNWLLLGLLTLIWGSSYILIRKSLDGGFTAIELACLRISISCTVALPLAIKGFKQVPRNMYFTIFLVGVFGSGAPSFLFALSMTKTGSAVNGILNSLSPLWTLIIGYYLFKVQISAQKIWGVLIGFSGALVLVLGKGGNLQVDILYSLLPLAATFCYGMSSNLTKQKLQNQNAIYATALAMSMIGLPALAGLFFTGAPAKTASGSYWQPLLFVASLSIFGTLVAWILFYRLVQRTDALFAASVTYLIPIVAIGWGLFYNETLNNLQLAGMVLILVGVYFTTRQSSPKSSPKEST